MRNFIDLISTMLLREDAAASRIPGRLPTGKSATDDPTDPSLKVDLNSAKTDRKSFEHNVGLIKKYAALPDAQRRGSADTVADHFVNHVRDNLLALHDAVPEHVRDRARKWYDGANRIATERAEEFGVPVATTAAVYAALSPQKTWHENASIGDRVLDAYLRRQNNPWTKEMEQTAMRIWSNEKNLPIFEAIKNRKLSDLSDIDLKAAWIRTYDEAHNSSDYPMVEPEGKLGRTYTNADAYGKGANNPDQPSKLRWGTLVEISKAIGAIESGGDMNTISKLMGERHKVRAFFNNINNPNNNTGDVTIDTHAVAAGLLHPLGGNTPEVAHNFKNSAAPGFKDGFTGAKGSAITGVHGTYPFYADGYRRAAEARNLLPREMQSITWEAAKGLFNGKGANKAKFLPQIKALWNQYQSGKMSADQVRNEIFKVSGGIEVPDWASDEQADKEKDNG